MSHNNKLKVRAVLSSDQSHEIREAFELFDINKDSKLDYHQLKVAIRALGFDLKKAEVLKIIRESNQSSTSISSNDGLIGFDSFHRVSKYYILYSRSYYADDTYDYDRIVEKMILNRDPLDELRRAFRLFDTDQKGKINTRDLKRVAKELGEGLSEDEL